jgi:hypothetical protein
MIPANAPTPLPLRIVASILKWLCFLIAFAWLASVVIAQWECSIIPSIGNRQCHNGEGDVWLLPFVFSQIGIPALLASIIIIIVTRVRRKARDKKLEPKI